MAPGSPRPFRSGRSPMPVTTSLLLRCSRHTSSRYLSIRVAEFLVVRKGERSREGDAPDNCHPLFSPSRRISWQAMAMRLVEADIAMNWWVQLNLSMTQFNDLIFSTKEGQHGEYCRSHLMPDRDRSYLHGSGKPEARGARAGSHDQSGDPGVRGLAKYV